MATCKKALILSNELQNMCAEIDLKIEIVQILIKNSMETELFFKWCYSHQFIEENSFWCQTLKWFLSMFCPTAEDRTLIQYQAHNYQFFCYFYQILDYGQNNVFEDSNFGKQFFSMILYSNLCKIGFKSLKILSFN